MTEEFTELEHQLRSLSPVALNTRLHSRLESHLVGIEHTDFAAPLQQAAPMALPDDLANRLEEILTRIPHPGTQKVVQFPEASKRAKAANPWLGYAAAAAVAILGGLSALLVPAETSPAPEIVSSPLVSKAANNNIDLAAFVPASRHSGLADARDEGIVWTDDHCPKRVLKLIYRDNVILRDDKGNQCELERPRVEYLMLPAQID